MNHDLDETDVVMLHEESKLCVKMMAELWIYHPKLKQPWQYTAGPFAHFPFYVCVMGEHHVVQSATAP